MIPSRVTTIDRARGIAVVIMVFTHATNALLAEPYRHGDLWNIAQILFGFAAPAFLFLSGITFGIAVQGSNSIRKTILRSLRLLFIAYWLQLPVVSLRQLIWNHRPNELAQLWSVNILQVIAVVTLATLVLWLLLRKIVSGNRADMMFTICVAIVGVCTALVSLNVFDNNLYRSFPLPIGAYIAPQPVSVFSLFPYAAYFFFGAAFSPWVTTRIIDFRTGIVIICIGLIVGSWNAMCWDVCLHLGGVVILLALCRREGVLRRLEPIGAASLGIYVLHLMMIYGSPVNMGLRAWSGEALAPIPVILIAIIAIVASHVLLGLYNRLRAEQPDTVRWIKRAVWVGFWILFLLKP